MNESKLISVPITIVTCCQSVSITASSAVKSAQWTRLGRFNFYKMGSSGRPIYSNSEKQYLYLDADGRWRVSNYFFTWMDKFFYKGNK